MIINTSELKGKPLDYAVGIAQGWSLKKINTTVDKQDGWGRSLGGSCVVESPHRHWHTKDGEIVTIPFYYQLKECDYKPSKLWGQGGPIIEKQQIELNWIGSDGDSIGWNAYHQDLVQFQCAETPLIAAMRVFVSAKIGEEIDIPEYML